jgi:glycosyltransferase involved in cell wall biosynthesis
MIDPKNRPWLTLIIGAYRHEQFIRQAVAGAFAQTYSPLQIILSDDGSTDRTFDIMREMAAAYRGPHEVLLNHNEKNLGLSGHVNRVVRLARGELLVFTAGDDIPLPNRAEASWQAWESTQRKAFGVHGLVEAIDASYVLEANKVWPDIPAGAFQFQPGAENREGYVRSRKPVVLGCTGAWHRSLFERFGPLPEEVVYEDMALAFRSLLSGGLVFVNHPLVLYRLHGNNIHHSEPEYVTTLKALQADEERKKTALRRRLIIAKSFRNDLEKAQSLGLLSESETPGLRHELDLVEESDAWELNYREAGFFRRLKLFAGRPKHGEAQTKLPAQLLYRLLPERCYYSTRLLKNRLRPGARARVAEAR